MTDKLQRLKEILGEVADLGRAGAVLAWDQETFMPPGGLENRADQLTTIERLGHSRFTSDEVGALLDAAEVGRPGPQQAGPGHGIARAACAGDQFGGWWQRESQYFGHCDQRHTGLCVPSGHLSCTSYNVARGARAAL